MGLHSPGSVPRPSPPWFTRLLVLVVAVISLWPPPTAGSWTYTLQGFELDMTLGRLILTFPTEMMSHTLNSTAIILQSRSTVAPGMGEMIRLSGDYNQLYSSDYNSTDIEVFLTNRDYYRLQMSLDFASSEENTYLTCDAGVIVSMSGVSTGAISNGHALKVSSFTPDRLPPYLQSFSINMNNGDLNLTFSEPVNLATFDASGLSFQLTQDKIYDPSWDQHLEMDWDHYQLVKQGVSVQGITYYNLGRVEHLALNDTYPYDYIGNLQGLMPNITVTWDGHDYTYRIDPNGTYWVGNEYFTGYDFTVHCNMGDINLNAIKAHWPLGTMASKIFLATYKPVIQDITGNNMTINTATDYLALPVDTFIPDTTRPRLYNFSLDMDLGALILDFSETVNIDNMDVSGLCLQTQKNWTAAVNNSASSGPRYCLTPGVSGSHETDRATVTVTLGKQDLNGIKLLAPDGLCISSSTTYLSFPSTLAVDMAWVENNVVEVPASEALSVLTYFPDVTTPSLLYFDLDWDERLLVLYFNEAIDAQTVMVTSITLQGSMNPGVQGSRYTLTSASNVTSASGAVITIYVGFDDYSAIKLTNNLANSADYTYISFPKASMVDFARPTPNPVETVPFSKAMKVRNYLHDKSPPYVRGFILDLEQNLLTIIWSEPVQVDTLNTMGVTLLSSESSYRLYDSGLAADSQNGMQTVVALGEADTRNIKADRSLCRSSADCYIQADAGIVMDWNPPLSNLNLASDPVPITTFIADNSPPSLLTWDLDMSDGSAVFNFNEPVQGATLDCSKIMMQSSDNPLNSTFYENITFTSYCTHSVVDGDEIKVILWRPDVARLKLLDVVGRVSDKTYLSLYAGFVQDMFGNTMSARSPFTDALLVDKFVADVQEPKLLSFDLDKDNEVLRLYFDEPVNASSLQPEGITLQGYSSRLNLPTTTLSSSSYADYTNSTDKTMLTVHLSSSDFNRLQAQRPRMGHQQFNTYLTMMGSTVKDLSDLANTNMPILDKYGLQVGPVLVGFSLDMDTATLTLIFSRTVDPNTFDITGLTFVNEEGSSSYELTGTGSGGYIYTEESDTRVVVGLTDKDMNEMKEFGDLAITQSSARLIVSHITISDPQILTQCCGPATVVEIIDTSLEATWYIEDSTPPQLVAFDLDLDKGTLSMVFDEPVVAGLVQLGGLSLYQRSIHRTFEMGYNSTVVSKNGTIQTVHLQSGGGLNQELDQIKLFLRDAFDKAGNLSLSIDKGSVVDMSMRENGLQAVDHFPIRTFVSDKNSPLLLYYDLNMDTSELTLVFNEPVNITSLDVRGLKLMPSATAVDSECMDLTLASVVKSKDDTSVVMISIGEDDMSRIKSLYPLASTVDFVYLYTLPAFCFDVAYPANQFPGGGPYKVSTYIQDYTSPTVHSFDLDMDSSLLTIRLDEPINPSRVWLPGITIQRRNFTGKQESWKYSLTTRSSEVLVHTYQDTVLVKIGKEDMDMIKMKDGVALDGCGPSESCTTQLVVNELAFKDVAGNSVNAIKDGYAMPVTNYTKDATPPELVAFSVYSNGRLMLYFSEPVLSSTFNVTGLTLENAGGTAYRITRRTFVENPRNNLVLSLDLTGDWSLNVIHGLFTPNADFHDIQALHIATTQLEAYLHAQASTCQDVAGNPLLPISRTSRIRMGPIVQSYDLDMNEGLLHLTFNLEVFGGSLIHADSIALQRVQNDSDLTSSLHLTPTSVSHSDNSTYITIELSQGDMFRIKSMQWLAVSDDTTYLTVDDVPPLTWSISKRPIDFFVRVVNIRNTNALPVTRFIPDTTRPYLSNYTIDVNAGTLDLTFSEPIVLQTFNVSAFTLYGSNTLEPFCVLTTVLDLTAFNGDWARDKIHNIQLNEADRICVSVYRVGQLMTMTTEAGTDAARPPNTLVDISPVSPIYATLLKRDVTPPTLVGASLDFTTGYLRLTFSEVVDPTTFVGSHVSLIYFDGTSNATIQFDQLAVTFSEAHEYVDVDLAFALTLQQELQGVAKDQYSLTGLPTFFDLATTYVHTAAGLVEDFASNSMLAQNVSLSNVTADTTRPTLLSFDLDLSSTSKKLYLWFDEAINASTVQPSQITILGTPDPQLSGITLSTSTVVVPATPDREVEVRLGNTEYSSLTTGSIAQSQDTTYLSMSAGAAYDLAPDPNAMYGTNQSQALQTGPVLHRVTLDMEREFMYLVFSKPIVFSSITSITIAQLTLIGNGTSLSLFNCSLTNMEGSSVTTSFVRVDLGITIVNTIKATPGIAKTTANTQFQVGQSLAVDDMGNTVVAVGASRPMSVYSYKPDVMHPFITRIDLDMDKGVLNFTFNEPIHVHLSQVEDITIQNTYTYNDHNLSVKFDWGDSIILTPTPYSEVLSIGIGQIEMDNLKESGLIATSRADTYITAVRDSFFDCATPPNTAWSILRSNAYQVDSYIPDQTRPVLGGFDFNLNDGLLRLFFSEPVDLSTFNVEGITLMEFAYTGYGSYHRLTNYTTIWRADTGRSLWVKLSPLDLYIIDANQNLAHIRDQTFLIMENGTVQDTAGNPVYGITDGEGVLVTEFTADTTSPKLLNYTIDMDTGIVHLYFDEMIMASSFKASGLVFESLDHSCFDYSTQGHTASSCNTLDWAVYQSWALTPTKTKYSGSDSSHLVFRLSEYDLNGIKTRSRLGKSRDTTYLVILPKACTDMSGNPVKQIGGLLPSYDPAIISRGMIAGIYYPDVSRPYLRAFDLDMNTGLLIMNFSKPVELNPINITGSNPKIREGRNYRLSFAPTSVSKDSKGLSNILTVEMAFADVGSLKAMGIGRRDVIRANGFGLDDSVWITMDAGAFVDATGLTSTPVLDGNVRGVVPVKVQELVVDQTRPRLSKYIVDDSTGSLHLYFNEAVHKSTMDPTAITLTIYINAVPYQVHLQTATQIPSLSPSTIILNLDNSTSPSVPSDWSVITSITEGRPVSDMYLSIGSSAVFDLAATPNGLRAISIYSPLKRGFPTCTCPANTFIKKACDAVQDVVCQPCSICPMDHYLLASCTPTADTQCSRCSGCRYPFYRSGPCTGANDTSCTPCTPCGSEEYEATPCTSIANRRCGSCKVCKFLSSKQEVGCRHMSGRWREENCCRNSAGDTVECKLMSLSEFVVDAMEGKRHWVFSHTVPEVQGHHQWTGNFFDWYQATKGSKGFA